MNIFRNWPDLAEQSIFSPMQEVFGSNRGQVAHFSDFLPHPSRQINKNTTFHFF
jgi:hypothetical protein